MIVNVTVTGDAVVLVSVPVMLPAPLAAIPVTVAVLFRVQLNVVAGTAPVSTIGVIAVPVQIDCADGVATAVGIGFTLITDVTGGELQPFTVATAVYVVVAFGAAYIVCTGVPV